MSNIIRKPLTDHELLLRVLCMSERDFELDRMKIELEPFKYFWRAVCAQADVKPTDDAEERLRLWAHKMIGIHGATL